MEPTAVFRFSLMTSEDGTHSGFRNVFGKYTFAHRAKTPKPNISIRHICSCTPTGRIFMNFHICSFHSNMSNYSEFYLRVDENNIFPAFVLLRPRGCVFWEVRAAAVQKEVDQS